MVGSTLGDVSSRLRRRALPRGGIRERDGLKVAEGALPDTTLISPSDGKGTLRKVLRIVAIVSGSLVALLLVLALVGMMLSHTDIFSITSIETYDSEHVSADAVGRLASLTGGETLLNVDTADIENKIKKNPWVQSVEISRVFPDTLRIVVHERSLGSYVAMSSGGIAWLLGDDGVWIEPMRVESGADESTNDVALAEAERLGVILISDVPATVSPVAGSKSNDSSIAAVMSFRSQLSSSFQEQIASYSAASEDDVSCILKNGVEVSFGSDTDVDTKESVAQRILDEYQGQVTYINVRVPSRPTYRRVNSSFVREGTGATGTSIDTEPLIGTMPRQGEENGDAEDSEHATDDAKNDGNTQDGEDVANGEDAASNGGSVGTDVGDAYGTDAYGYDPYGAYDSYDGGYAYEDYSSYDSYGY